MPGSVREFCVPETTLNTVAAGLALAHQIIDALQQGDAVRLDLSAANRMTPSFANALVMTILEAVGEPVFRDRLTILCSSDSVADAWSKAAGRYARGIRLSTQQPGAA